MSQSEIEIRALRPGDDELLLRAAAGVFDWTPRAEWVAEFLSDHRHHIVVALDAGEVVGFVSAVHYIHPDKPAELWLNEVGVAATHRNRRIGHRLMQDVLALGRALGCRCAWVLTDRGNTPAMRLYAGTGGIAEPVPSILFEFELSPSSGSAHKPANS